MARKIGSVGVGYLAGNWTLRLYEASVTQNISGNYSDVVVYLTLGADRSTWISFDSRDAWIGSTHFTPAYRHDNPEHEIGRTTIRVNHDADGTGSYSLSFGLSTSYILKGSSTASNIKLPTIPRASDFTVSGDTLGSAVNVTIKPASTAFKHKVTLEFGTKTLSATDKTTSCSFAPPMDWGSEIPNAMSGTGSITVDTYNGTTLVGSKSKQVTLRIDPSKSAPTFTFTNANITRIDNGVDSSWGVYVQGFSKARIRVTDAKALYGATVASTKISVDNYEGEADLTTGTFLAGKRTIKATVTDSRNISTNKVLYIDVLENQIPSLSIVAKRCNSSGVETPDGTYAKVSPTYSPSSINNKNYITSATFAVESIETQYIESGKFKALGKGSLLGNKSYVVTGTVIDALKQKQTITVTVPVSTIPFDLKENAAGFGKYAEKTNAIDSAWDLYTKGVWNAPAVKKTRAGAQTGIQIILEEV